MHIFSIYLYCCLFQGCRHAVPRGGGLGSTSSRPPPPQDFNHMLGVQAVTAKDVQICKRGKNSFQIISSVTHTKTSFLNTGGDQILETGTRLHSACTWCVATCIQPHSHSFVLWCEKGPGNKATCAVGLPCILDASLLPKRTRHPKIKCCMKAVLRCHNLFPIQPSIVDSS